MLLADAAKWHAIKGYISKVLDEGLYHFSTDVEGCDDFQGIVEAKYLQKQLVYGFPKLGLSYSGLRNWEEVEGDEGIWRNTYADMFPGSPPSARSTRPKDTPIDNTRFYIPGLDDMSHLAIEGVIGKEMFGGRVKFRSQAECGEWGYPGDMAVLRRRLRRVLVDGEMHGPDWKWREEKKGIWKYAFCIKLRKQENRVKTEIKEEDDKMGGVGAWQGPKTEKEEKVKVEVDDWIPV